MKERFLKLVLRLLIPAIVLAGCVPAGPALHEAAMKDDVESLRELLKQGNNINEYWYFHTPLGSAASVEMMKAAEYLIESGADVDLTIKGLNNGIGFCEQFRNQSPADAQRCSDSYRNQIGFVKVAKVRKQLEMYSKSGQTERAIEAMNQWLTSGNPQDALGFERLSGLYIQNRQYNEAIAAAKRAIELKPDLADAHMNLGIAHRREKRYGEAFRALNKAIELNPKSDVYHANLGGCYFDAGDLENAIAEIRKAADLNPKNQYLLDLTSLYHKAGRQEDAIDFANRLIEARTIRGIWIASEIEGEWPVVRGTKDGLSAKKAGIQPGDVVLKVDDKPTKGMTSDQFVQLIRGEPGTRVTLTVRRAGTAEPFPVQVARELYIDPPATEGFAFRSLAHRSKGNRVDAFRDAEKAVSLYPTAEMAQLALGAAQLDRGNHQESIAALSGVKTGARARILEATALARRGEMEKAEKVYSAISEEALTPKDAPLAADRAALLQAFRPAVAARREKAKSFAAKNQNGESLLELADALRIAEDSEAEAIREAMSALLKKNPRLAEEMPEEARKHALRAEMYVKEGKFGEAVGEYKKAIRIAPYVPRLHYNCAQVLAESRNYPDAIRSMKTYLKVAADAPDVRKAKDDIIQWEFMMEKGS